MFPNQIESESKIFDRMAVLQKHLATNPIQRPYTQLKSFFSIIFWHFSVILFVCTAICYYSTLMEVKWLVKLELCVCKYTWHKNIVPFLPFESQPLYSYHQKYFWMTSTIDWHWSNVYLNSHRQMVPKKGRPKKFPNGML